MQTRPNDILNLINITKEELFSVPSNSIVLTDKDHIPCGEVYVKDNKIGVRFGDFSPSPRHKVLK